MTTKLPNELNEWQLLLAISKLSNLQPEGFYLDMLLPALLPQKTYRQLSPKVSTLLSTYPHFQGGYRAF